MNTNIFGSNFLDEYEYNFIMVYQNWANMNIMQSFGLIFANMNIITHNNIHIQKNMVIDKKNKNKKKIRPYKYSK